MRKIFRCACQESGCDHFAFRSTNAENSALFLLLILVPALAYRVCAQSSGAAGLKSGRAIFEAGCAGCHGGNGKGAPETHYGI